jgi:hypothetical protein
MEPERRTVSPPFFVVPNLSQFSAASLIFLIFISVIHPPALPVCVSVVHVTSFHISPLRFCKNLFSSCMLRGHFVPTALISLKYKVYKVFSDESSCILGRYRVARRRGSGRRFFHKLSVKSGFTFLSINVAFVIF